MMNINIFDIMKASRATASLDDFAVPIDYDGDTPDVTTTLKNAPTGEYALSYNFVLDYAGQKDKALAWKVTGTHTLGIEYSETVQAASANTHKNRLYGTRIMHTTVGDLTLGLQFRSLNGVDYGFKVLICDVSITKVASL